MGRKKKKRFTFLQFKSMVFKSSVRYFDPSLLLKSLFLLVMKFVFINVWKHGGNHKLKDDQAGCQHTTLELKLWLFYDLTHNWIVKLEHKCERYIPRNLFYPELFIKPVLDHTSCLFSDAAPFPNLSINLDCTITDGKIMKIRPAL